MRRLQGEYMEIVKIPERRIKSIIGEEGKTKKLLERKCRVKLSVDNEGEVQIEGDAADEFFAKDVIKAVGRGFDPNDAIKILDEDYQFQLIDLKDILRSDKMITRIKGRIIGEKGKMKTEIEQATESKIAVYGFTVGVISQHDTIEYAVEAIKKLINGSEHARVYGYLAKVKKDILRKKLA